MKRELTTFGVALVVLVGVLAFSQPTAAVLTTVSGPDQVSQSDEIAFETTVELREDERIPVESFDLTVAPNGTSRAVTVNFTPDGTVQSVDTSGGAGDDINVSRLEQSLRIVRTDGNAEFGYGYRSGTDERTGENHTFGYGYGYGYSHGDAAQPSFGFDIQFDAAAFDPGAYTVQVSVNTGAETDMFASNVKAFEVEPSEVTATLDVEPDTLNKQSQGKWVTSYIELSSHNVSAIDIDSVELEGVPAVNDSKYGFVSNPEIKDRDWDGSDELMVKFPRDVLAETL